MTPEKILDTMRAKKWKEAKWLTEALLRSKGVSKAVLSHGSTKSRVPLCAADLPTLLGMLLEIPTPTESWMDGTSRSSLRKAITYLRKSSGTSCETGQVEEPTAPSSIPLIKPLSSNRKYWPGSAKDVFWYLVKALNKYDKENMPGGQRSPLQLSIAEAAVREWWRADVHPDDVLAVEKAASSLGAEVAWIRAA